jgi:hypothetical protein
MQPLAGEDGVRRAPPSAVAVRTADFDGRPGGAECMRIMHQGGAGSGPLRPSVAGATNGHTAAKVSTRIPFCHATHAANSLVKPSAGADTSAAQTGNAAAGSDRPMHEYYA